VTETPHHARGYRARFPFGTRQTPRAVRSSRAQPGTVHSAPGATAVSRAPARSVSRWFLATRIIIRPSPRRCAMIVIDNADVECTNILPYSQSAAGANR
jgi:hypothetical protein